MYKANRIIFKSVRLVIFLFILYFFLSFKLTANAATNAQKESCKQEILKMLYSADTSVHSISKYKITKTEFNEIIEQLRLGEADLIMGAYYYNMDFSNTVIGNKVYTTRIVNADKGALTRYQKMVKNVDTIMAGIESDMSDLDKIIYLHDAVVKGTVYGGNDNTMFCPAGVLSEGVAVCQGYAEALNLLLNRVGIKNYYVTNNGHGWSYVQLDGNWYHIDSTWDDTRSGVAGQTGRKYLLVNDTEMARDHNPWTVVGTTVKSNSNLYSNNVYKSVVGDMFFEDGYWYYVDCKTKDLMRLDANNNTSECLLVGAELDSIYINSCDDSSIDFVVNGKEFELSTKDIVDFELPEESKLNVADVIWEDINAWQSGDYLCNNGLYSANTHRLCLNQYVTCDELEYTVSLSDEDYHLLVRELDKNKKFISSHNFVNGDTFTPTEYTKYLAIAMYYIRGEAAISYSTYVNLFNNGFVANLTAMVDEDENNGEVIDISVEIEIEESDDAVDEIVEAVEVEKTDIVATIDEEDEVVESDGADEKIVVSPQNLLDIYNLNDISNWRSGVYHYQTGLYDQHANRICLNEYLVFESRSYQINISDPDYHVLIRELDENMKFLTSYNFEDGNVFVPHENAKYIAVSIYYYRGEYNHSFDTFRNLFANGFTVNITPIQ